MSEHRDERTPTEDDVVEPDAAGVGPREDDQTVSAEELVELTDEPKPMEPSD